MNLPFKAILWDIDGTLLDSEPVHERGIIASAVSEKINVPHSFVESLVGVGLKETHARLATDLGMRMSYEDWERFIEVFYVDNAHDASPRENVLEIIRRFHALHIPQACVSNSPRIIVDANMKTLAHHLNGSHNALQFSLSRDDVYEPKPSPEGFLMAARRLGVSPKDCVVVEDSCSGMKAGKAAGMTVIAWPQVAHMDTSAACHVVTSLDDYFVPFMTGAPHPVKESSSEQHA